MSDILSIAVMALAVLAILWALSHLSGGSRFVGDGEDD